MSAIDAIQSVIYICKLGDWRKNSTLESRPYREENHTLQVSGCFVRIDVEVHKKLFDVSMKPTGDHPWFVYS